MCSLFVDIYRPTIVCQRHEWLHPLNNIIDHSYIWELMIQFFPEDRA
jgi:hypothetical protein